MKNIEKISVALHLFVDCPSCSHTIDLINVSENDEGEFTRVLRSWLNNEKGADKIEKQVQCPECDKTIKLGEIEY